MIDRPPADHPGFVAWCVTTQDLMAFKYALGRVADDQWPTVQTEVAAALSIDDPRRPGGGNAAARDRRGRAAALVLKLEILEQQAAWRLSRGSRSRAASGS